MANWTGKNAQSIARDIINDMKVVSVVIYLTIYYFIYTMNKDRQRSEMDRTLANVCAGWCRSERCGQ